MRIDWTINKLIYNVIKNNSSGVEIPLFAANGMFLLL